VAPTTAEVSVCFTPGPASCAALIANAIDAARVSIRVQAYWLTSTPILAALAAAQRRGVDVEAILDKSQDRQGETRGRYSSAVYLVHAGVRVWIDEAPAIAHNKIIVIDASRVVTGSFNFTKSADTRNAENVVVLDSREVASWFTGNWEARRDVSRAFAAE
jgi:phosphatidylserine/phosphatidylglycerophosphate/cardiolipin synthase-like enzyme